MRGVLAGCVISFSACQLGPVCTQHHPVSQSDGGSFRCVRSEDCPLPSNTEVCTSTSDYETTCVACQDTSCVTFSKVDCK
jgi:hypothetical protein